METLVLDGQSLFDIAVQECGSVEAAFALAVANDIGITDEITPGTYLKKTSIVNKKIVDYYTLKNLKPATSSTIADGETVLTGIGYMAIGKNFIVS